MNRFTIKSVALATSLMLMGSILVGCSSSSSSNSSDEVASTNVVAHPTVPKTEGQSIAGTIGEQIVNEDVGITLKNIYSIDIDDGDNVYIAFELEIVNNSDVEHEFSNIIDFGARVDGGTEDIPDVISPANTIVYIERYTDFNNLRGVVAPGTMLDGLVTMILPADYQEATLVFYPNVNTSTGEITFTVSHEDFETLPTNS